MTRGNGFPVASLALVALIWLPAVGSGQLLEDPDEERPIFEPLLDDPEPTAQWFALPRPAAVNRASAVSHGGYQQPVLDQLDTGSQTYEPHAGEVADYCPNCATAADSCPGCGMVYDEPGFGSGGLRRRLRNALPFPRPRGRHQGIGHPLQRESWLYRPFSAGWFMGMVQGSPLIDDWVGQQRGFFAGYRLGWDSTYYWGAEMRFAFGSVPLYDSPRARRAQRDADTQAGYAEDDPWRQRFEQRRDADLFQWDLDLLYYPWGDSQWRPYLMVGLGTARIGFMDRLSQRYDKVVFAVPLAVGLKYRCSDWLALRFECADNIAFAGGSGLSTLHNLSVTGGVEVRFGGSRRAYWPWNPGRYYW